MEKRSELAKVDRKGKREHSTRGAAEDDADRALNEPSAEPVANPYFAAAAEGIILVKEWLEGRVIRRTMQSKDADGNSVVPPIPHAIVDSVVQLVKKEHEQLAELVRVAKTL